MIALLSAAALVAVLELDVASFGQLMLGRPIVVGPLLGFAFGDPGLGAGLGALFELFSLGELPVGGKVPLNGAVGVGAAFLICAAGGAAVELGFAAGVAAAALHGRLEALLRRLRGGGPERAIAALARGERPRLLPAALRELALQAGGTFALLSLALGLRAVELPDALAGGLRLGLALAPWVGIAGALAALRGTA